MHCAEVHLRYRAGPWPGIGHGAALRLPAARRCKLQWIARRAGRTFRWLTANRGSDGSAWAAWATHGGTPAEGRLRRRHLEPHPVQGRAARREGRQGRGQALRTRRTATWCSPSSRPARTSSRSISARTASLTGNKTPGMFVDCSTIAVDDSVDIRAKLKERGAEFVCCAGERQRQGDQGRQAVGGVLGAGGRVPQGRAAGPGGGTQGRVLRG